MVRFSFLNMYTRYNKEKKKVKIKIVAAQRLAGKNAVKQKANKK